MKSFMSITAFLLAWGGQVKAQELQPNPNDWKAEKAYCSAVGYAHTDANVKPSSDKFPTWEWRCVSGKTYACIVPADGVNCSVRSSITKPFPAMIEACAQEGGYLPVSSGAYASKWHWECKDGKPVIVGLRWKVDTYGYVINEWQEVR